MGDLDDLVTVVDAMYHGEGLVTRIVVIVDLVDRDGERGLYTSTASHDGHELAPWETRGMLEAAADMERIGFERELHWADEDDDDLEHR